MAAARGVHLPNRLLMKSTQILPDTTARYYEADCGEAVTMVPRKMIRPSIIPGRAKREARSHHPQITFREDWSGCLLSARWFVVTDSGLGPLGRPGITERVRTRCRRRSGIPG